MSGIKGIHSGKESTLYVHGGTGTRIHNIWLSMRERCNRVNHPWYKAYGGRGIKICEEWNDFSKFRQWAMINGYSDELTIDRIDYNKGYEPNNCRWATMKEQQNNKRSNRIIEYKCKRYTLTQLAEKIGINKTTLKERLNAGWSVNDAVERPVRKRTKGWRQSA